MNEKRRCSILFHFEVPGGKWQTSISRLGLVGEPLQLDLPQSRAVAVGAAAVGGDRQPGSVRVALGSEVLPPGADRVDRELGGVVVDADVDIPLVELEVVDAVGDRLAELLVLEVVDAHELWLALQMPLAPAVLEVADQLLLLAIDRNHGPAGNDRRLRGLVDVLKLGVAVGMGGPLLGLDVGLQRVAQQPHQHRHRREVRLVARLAQRTSDLTHTLGSPPQKRLRITPAVLVNQPLDGIQNLRVALQQRLATSTHTTHPPRQKALTRLELGDALTDRRHRYTRRPRSRCDATKPRGTRLTRRPQPPLTLVQLRRHRPEPLTNTPLINHTPTVPRKPAITCNVIFLRALSGDLAAGHGARGVGRDLSRSRRRYDRGVALLADGRGVRFVVH